MPAVCFDIERKERPVFVLAGPRQLMVRVAVTHASDFTLDTSLGGGQGGAAASSHSAGGGCGIRVPAATDIPAQCSGVRCKMLATLANTFFDQPDGRKEKEVLGMSYASHIYRWIKVLLACHQM